MSTLLLLTHKRRGAVVLFPSGAPSFGGAIEAAVFARFGSAAVEGTSAYACAVECAFESDAHGRYLVHGGLVAGIGKDDTAEVLASLYAAVLTRAGMTDAGVETLAVGVGPGSFTGLRLGCAFGNGLLLGRPRRALAVDTPGVEGAQAPLASLSARGLASCVLGLLGGEPPRDDDPFSAPVSLADALAVAHALDRGGGEEVSEFSPRYGREPGPVLKLRSQGGHV